MIGKFNPKHPDNPDNPTNPMIIGGLQKFSLLDYPGFPAAIVFTQGCNFRCQFCYNPMLVGPEARRRKDKKGYPLSEDSLFVFLRRRAGKLDAVVITGGEPTIHTDLPDFISRVRELGYKIKLDTNGTNHDMLAGLIKNKALDYIAMDVKGPANKYETITGTQPDLNNIGKSVKILIESGLPHEFRTTVVPGLISENDIAAAGKMITGADKWFLQRFRSDTALVNRELETVDSYDDEMMEKMRKIGEKFVKRCEVR